MENYGMFSGMLFSAKRKQTIKPWRNLNVSYWAKEAIWKGYTLGL
jgi:hypothetical protein